MPVIVNRTELVPIKSIKTYERNPRIGNIDAIAESLNTSGQFKPIVVNDRTMQILAGNHTYLAARKLGWDEIYASFVNVDDDTAKRIVLADNRTADMGEYDDSIIAELLASLPDVTGTGYTDVDLDELLESVGDVTESLASITTSIDQENDLVRRMEEAETFDGSPLGDEPDPRLDQAEQKKGALESASEKLGGVIQMSAPEETVFEGIGPWQIPKLDEDMLMRFEELPANLDSWAGSATKDWPDDDQWWLYNWGIDSTSGMKDISKVVLSFYAFDHYFDNWWYYPERYVPKVLNSRIKYAITPNWSMPTELPLVESLWNLYRARWIGRYLQEAGVKIIPDIIWPDGNLEFLREHTLSTLPVGLPMISMQYQTVDWDKAIGGKPRAKESLKIVLDTLQPQGALFYAGTQGREFLQPIVDQYPEMSVKMVPTRMEKLAVQAKSRTKKVTI